MIALLKKNVTVKDSGDVLSAKYVTVSADDLLDAMLNKEDGTYRVTVYAKDVAGNKSKKIAFRVKYTSVKDDTDKPDDNNTDKPDDNNQDNNTEQPDDNNQNNTNTENPDSSNTENIGA